MKIHLILAAVCLCAVSPVLPGADEPPKTVYASSFGFNAEDATECLQKAIDSGAEKVIVENMVKPWIVRPLKLRSNLHLVFKAGVVVEAKEGEFRGKGDSLFSAENCKKITMEGEDGAVLRMRKKDYQNPKLGYSRSQWRNTIGLVGCFNVTIRNLTIASSGGDGIYLGRTYGKDGRIACRNVLIENCLIDDHHRQGISVISAIGLTIRNCVISNTRGTEPEAGIDFEPNYPDERFNNILIEKCTFKNNNWSDINCSIFTTTPIDITIRDCTLSGGRSAQPPLSFCLLEPFVRSGGGLIKVENCKIENSRTGLLFMNFASDTNYQVEFKNVELTERKFGSRDMTPSPIVFSAGSPKTTVTGGIRFDNMKITGYEGVPLFSLDSFGGNKNVEKVTGNVIWNGKNIDVEKVVTEDSSLHRKPYVKPDFSFTPPKNSPAPQPVVSAAIRAGGEAAIWADQGEKVSFSLEQKYYDGAPNTKIRGTVMKFQVVTPSGKIIELPDWIYQQSGASCKRDYEFTAEETGIYSLNLVGVSRRRSPRYVTLFHGGPGLRWGLRGLAEQDGVLDFRNQPGLGCPETVEGVFEVPAGVSDFWIDTDIMDFTVTDPSGKTWQPRRIRGQQQRLTFHRDNPEKREIWKLKAEKFVSLRILFSENIPGILAADETLLPLSAEK